METVRMMWTARCLLLAPGDGNLGHFGESLDKHFSKKNIEAINSNFLPKIKFCLSYQNLVQRR